MVLDSDIVVLPMYLSFGGGHLTSSGKQRRCSRRDVRRCRDWVHHMGCVNMNMAACLYVLNCYSRLVCGGRCDATGLRVSFCSWCVTHGYGLRWIYGCVMAAVRGLIVLKVLWVVLVRV